VRPVERALSRLEGVVERNGYDAARCPVAGHGKGRGDLNPSLSINEGDDGRVLLRCQAGCSTEAVVNAMGLTMRDLFPDNGQGGRGGAYPPNDTSTLQRLGVALEEYASHKKLPIEHLTEVCRVERMTYKSRPAVRMPYLDEEGRVACSRFRVSLEGKPKILTKSFRQ